MIGKRRGECKSLPNEGKETCSKEEQEPIGIGNEGTNMRKETNKKIQKD